MHPMLVVLIGSDGVVESADLPGQEPVGADPNAADTPRA